MMYQFTVDEKYDVSCFYISTYTIPIDCIFYFEKRSQKYRLNFKTLQFLKVKKGLKNKELEIKFLEMIVKTKRNETKRNETKRNEKKDYTIMRFYTCLEVLTKSQQFFTLPDIQLFTQIFI